VVQRVYLPLTASTLRRAREEGSFGAPPLMAHAVTPTLVEALGASGPEQEECEYAAMTAAALESLELMGPDDPPRRLVAAVDVPAWEPRPGTEEDAESTAVAVPTPVAWRRLAAVHADGPDAEDDVRAARDAVSSAAGDDLADHPADQEARLEALVERCLGHDLGWFAAQEVDELLRDLGWGSPPGRATIG
jgi:hypothetical protein